MAGKGKGLPIDVRAVLDAVSALAEDQKATASLVICVDTTADPGLVGLMKASLAPVDDSCRVQVRPCDGARIAPTSDLDLVCVIVGSDETSAVPVREAARCDIPCIIVTADIADCTQALASGGDPLPADRIIVLDTRGEDRFLARLGEMMVEVCSARRQALARAFPFVRRPLALEEVRTTSLQNAAVGAIPLIPGADMPVMTANQAKMVLRIAAAFGYPMGLVRAREVAVVVAGGLGLRTLAREMCGAVPVLGWMVRGGIGYSGTYARGMAAIAWFEHAPEEDGAQGGALPAPLAGHLGHRAVDVLG